MDNSQVLQILKESEALLEGHFLLTSGLHSNGYVQCAKLLRFADKAAQVLSVAAQQLKGLDIDVVCGPAMGGVIVSYELGRQLGKENIFTERQDGLMQLRRGFSLERGMNVLITEDVITTGKSTMETVAALEDFGVNIVGLACIADRRAADSVFALPVYSCIKLDIETYDPSDCPLCREGRLDVVKPGSRTAAK